MPSRLDVCGAHTKLGGWSDSVSDFFYIRVQTFDSPTVWTTNLTFLPAP